MVKPTGTFIPRPLYPPGYDQKTIDAKIAAASATPAAPVGSVQYDNAGAFGGAAKVSIDANGSETHGEYSTTDPTAPAAGVTLFARKRVNRDQLGFIGPNMPATEVAPHLAHKGVSFSKVQGGSVTIGGVGFSNTSIGTATLIAPATTNIKTQSRRLLYLSAAGAGSSCGWLNNTLMAWRGNAAGLGGFTFVCRFGFTLMPATVRFFCGLVNTTAALSNADPSTQTDVIGVSFDVADANFQVLEINNVPTPTKHNAGFSWGTNEVYEVRISCKPNDTLIYVSIQKLSTGAMFEQACNTTIPENNIFLAPQLWLNNGTTASAVEVDFISAYLESDT